MSSLLPVDPAQRSRPSVILLGALLGFLIGEIAAMVLVAVGAHVANVSGGLRAVAGSSTPPWWANALSLGGLWTGFAVAIYVASTRGQLRALAHQWRLQPSDSLYVLLGLALQALVVLAYRPFHFKQLNQPVHHLFGDTHGPTFVVVALLTTLGAPFMEEWFFRGVVFRGLRDAFADRTPRVASWAAIIVSAGLFALAHAEPLQFAGLAFLGVILALLVQQTERLTPSIITHVSFNAVAMVALVVQRSGH